MLSISACDGYAERGNKKQHTRLAAAVWTTLVSAYVLRVKVDWKSDGNRLMH